MGQNDPSVWTVPSSGLGDQESGDDIDHNALDDQVDHDGKVNDASASAMPHRTQGNLEAFEAVLGGCKDHHPTNSLVMMDTNSRMAAQYDVGMMRTEVDSPAMVREDSAILGHAGEVYEGRKYPSNDLELLSEEPLCSCCSWSCSEVQEDHLRVLPSFRRSTSHHERFGG